MLLLCNRYYSISGACTMLAAALHATSDRVGEDPLKPGALVSDHAAGVRAGLKAIFPDAPHMQCWPHLMRKYKEGNLCVKAKKSANKVKAKGKKSANKGKKGNKGNKGKKGKKGKKSKGTKKGKKKGQSTGHQQVASEETTQNEDGHAVSEPDVVLEEEAQEEEAQEAHAEEEEAQQEEAHADEAQEEEAQEEEAQEEEAKGANEDGGVTKTHPHYKEIKKHLKLVHLAQTTAMRCSHYFVVIVIFLFDPFHIFLSNQIYPQFI